MSDYYIVQLWTGHFTLLVLMLYLLDVALPLLKYQWPEPAAFVNTFPCTWFHPTKWPLSSSWYLMVLLQSGSTHLTQGLSSSYALAMSDNILYFQTDDLINSRRLAWALLIKLRFYSSWYLSLSYDSSMFLCLHARL